MNRPSIEGGPSTRWDILVVDEEAPLRDLLARALEQAGHTVWLAASGREAQEIFQLRVDAIAVVLLDVGMSGLDGPQTLAALSAIRSDLRCCFMTGGGGKYTEAELLRMGAVRVFLKPFSPGDLVHFLKQLAGAGELRTSLRHGEKQFKVFVVYAGSSAPMREGWLQDYSSGGVGVLLPEAVTVGSVLRMLRANSPGEASGAEVLVRHCRPRDNGWFVGGRFLDDARSATFLIGA
jgi:CheY-like chemotaxis protein